ncbi:MAG: sugar ABC transporter ATP-binding protein [Actinomycetota bacterium]
MAQYVLEAQNITKDFTAVRALSNVSLSVRPGEILGLIGENGAGKSTILKVINGIYISGTFEGKILINGEEVHLHSPHDALVKGIGFVPQEINVMEDLTVAENIFVGHLTQSKSSFTNLADTVKRAADFLKLRKINLDVKTRVRMLSIGQKQLLMIARALSWDPHILILDEPTTALAKVDVDNLFEIVREFKAGGRSIIFVTHKLEEIMELTDRVVILRDGANIATYEHEQYNENKIITDMVGRTITSMYPPRNVEIGKEVLRVENLTVAHPKIKNKNLIENVSFNLKKCEVLGLVGLVGAGRTETLSALFGEYPITSGKIFIEGKEVKIKNSGDAIKNGLCLVTEDRKANGLLMLANIKHNIVLTNLKKIITGWFINSKKENNVAKTYMAKLSIKAPNYDTMVATLSGGNQQKVVISKSLNTDPKILLLDEPTKGIDVGSKNEIYNLINTMADMGISIIMVSSELPELLAMCDRFVILAHGKTVGELLKSEATQETVMVKCFA